MAVASRPDRVFLASLGCAKNLVDSEVMLGRLASDGWALTTDADDADAIVVNTCSFIDPAKAESTDEILRYAGAKRSGQLLIVAGCLAQRYGAETSVLDWRERLVCSRCGGHDIDMVATGTRRDGSRDGSPSAPTDP